MYVKKLKRKCSVRGCKNTDTFAISLTREVGNTVIACKSCLEKALGAIDNLKTEPAVPSVVDAPPALFFSDLLQNKPVKESEQTDEPPEQTNDGIDHTPEEPSGAEQTDDEVPVKESEQTEFVCPHCGQVCKSELGLQSHIKAKHKDLV